MSRDLNCWFWGVVLYFTHSREHLINWILLLRRCVGAVAEAEPHSPARGAPSHTPARFQSGAFSPVTFYPGGTFSVPGGRQGHPILLLPEPPVLLPILLLLPTPRCPAPRTKSPLYSQHRRLSALSPHQRAPFTAGEGVTRLGGLPAMGLLLLLPGAAGSLSITVAAAPRSRAEMLESWGAELRPPAASQQEMSGNT